MTSNCQVFVNSSQSLETERVLVIPDAQVGFKDNKPTHSRLGFEAAVYLASEYNKIVLLGDMLDLPALGKYKHGNDLRGKTSKAVRELRYWLERLVDANPDADIHYIFGNHEERLRTLFKTYCPDLEDLFSLEEALGLDDLGITAHAPYGVDYRYKGVIYTHGHLHAKEGGLTATKYLNEYNTNVVYGHCHKRALTYKTDTHGNERWAMSPGMICAKGGVVPGSSRYSNWQEGLGEVVYHKGRKPQASLIPIQGNNLFYEGTCLTIKHDHNARQKELGF